MFVSDSVMTRKLGWDTAPRISVARRGQTAKNFVIKARKDVQRSVLEPFIGQVTKSGVAVEKLTHQKTVEKTLR
jgi:hypothetical protein